MVEQFTVRGSNLKTTELLGVWQAEPAPDTSYGLAEADDAGDVVWSASLPEDPALASRALQSSFEGLSLSRQAVRRAEQTLEYLPPDWLDQEEILDYGVGPSDVTTRSTPPELETLRRNMNHLVGDDPEAISYGLGVPDHWQGTVEGYRDFINEMTGLLKPTLITETRFAEAMLAVTVVGLTCDLKTTWYQKRRAELDFAHQQVVALSLGTRLALLQLLGQISTGAQPAGGQNRPGHAPSGPAGRLALLPGRHTAGSESGRVGAENLTLTSLMLRMGRNQHRELTKKLLVCTRDSCYTFLSPPEKSLPSRLAV